MSVVLVVLVLLTGGVDAGVARAADEANANSTGGTLSNEDLPLNARVSVLTQYLIALAKTNPEAGLRIVGQAGLEIDAAQLQSLGELYGDYDDWFNEIRRAQIAGLDHDPELRHEVVAELVREREAFAGSVLGRWLRSLDEQGHDAKGFLRRLVLDESRGISIGGSSGLALDEQRLKAERFGEGFAGEYGTTTREIVEADEEAIR